MIRPKVSVIVAVYNVEVYIAQCCHSLFAQTLDNIEFIFVDDCSSDCSINIMQSVLKEYPGRKDQVKIIRHQKNMGVSRSREDGVRAACGEYIIHCDPDDWVELNMYEQLYQKAVLEDADMVLCDSYDEYADDPQSYYQKSIPLSISGKSLIASYMGAQHPLLISFLWNKLIRAKYYESVEWPYHVFCGEDMIISVQILLQSPRISYIGSGLYHYRFRDGSLSKMSYSMDNFKNDCEVVAFLDKYLCHSGDKELYGYWQAFVGTLIINGVEKSSQKLFTNKEFSGLFKLYRNCIWKNQVIHPIKKVLGYIATYNYDLAFTIFKIGKKMKAFLH